MNQFDEFYFSFAVALVLEDGRTCSSMMPLFSSCLPGKHVILLMNKMVLIKGEAVYTHMPPDHKQIGKLDSLGKALKK